MSARPNAVLAAITGLVVVLAVVAGVLTTRREPPTLDASTPEGTVQLFVLAFIEGEDEAAVAFLDPDLGCTAPCAMSTVRPVSLALVSTKTSGRAPRSSST